jgi:hypothetical protein
MGELRMKPTIAMNDVLRIIRIDGDPDSDFVFLTIEDGGRTYYDSTEILNDSKQDLVRGNFTPGKANNVEELGVPGKILSKIMSCLFSTTSNIDGWERYAENKLYKGNECNLKFYPLGRPNQNSWKEYEEITGFGSEEYLGRCRSERPKLIYNHNKLRPLIRDVDKKHFIIAAACKEWLPFMNLLFPPETMGPIRIFHSKNRPDENNKQMVYRFYYRKDGKSLAYTYINLFRRPLLDEHIKQFADAYKEAVKDSNKLPIPSVV